MPLSHMPPGMVGFSRPAFATRFSGWTRGRSIHHLQPASAGLATRRLRAFTLIELLVVIALIALLLAILLPSLAASRRCAQAAACASNLRQIATVNLQYASDHSDYLVPAADDIWDTG